MWHRREGVSESQLRSRKHGGETLGGARSQTDYQRTGGGGQSGGKVGC